jgi:type I restriction enzyme, S subunit
LTWQQTRLKFLADCPIQNGLGESGGEDNPDWPRYVRTTDIAGPHKLRDDVFASLPPEVADKALLQPGDILMTAAGATIGKSVLYLDNRPACFAGYLVRFRAGRSVDARFVSYWTESQPYWDQIRASRVVSTIENFSASKYQNLRLSTPALATQRAIADYLDRETARIDALIAAKRRMTELLEERWHSAREEMVSQAWHADSAIRLGYLLREVDERLGNGEAPPLLSVSIHHGVIPFADANPDRVPRADDLGSYKRCKCDDIILNRMRAFQGGIGRATGDGIVSPDYAVLRPSSTGISVYLHHLLRSPWFVGQMEKRLRGIGGVEQGNVRTPRVNWDDLRTVIVPSPSPTIQIALAKRLESELSNSWQTQKVIERQIAFIQEHRRALITAAVTGQLDIPDAA